MIINFTNGYHNNLRSQGRPSGQKRVNYLAVMMRSAMTTMRRAEALNEEVTGKSLSMCTLSNSQADDFNFQLHDFSIEVIGTALSFQDKAVSLDLSLPLHLCIYAL